MHHLLQILAHGMVLAVAAFCWFGLLEGTCMCLAHCVGKMRQDGSPSTEVTAGLVTVSSFLSMLCFVFGFVLPGSTMLYAALAVAFGLLAVMVGGLTQEIIEVVAWRRVVGGYIIVCTCIVLGALLLSNF